MSLVREDHQMASHGTLVLLGGGEVGDPDLGSALLALAPGPRVAIIPMAMGRSKLGPCFLMSAGARFTVVRLRGQR